MECLVGLFRGLFWWTARLVILSKFLRSCACGCNRGDVVVCGKAPQSSCMVMKLPRLDFWSCCQGLLKNVRGVYERGSGGRGRLMDAVRLGGGRMK